MKDQAVTVLKQRTSLSEYEVEDIPVAVFNPSLLTDPTVVAILPYAEYDEPQDLAEGEMPSGYRPCYLLSSPEHPDTYVSISPTLDCACTTIGGVSGYVESVEGLLYLLEAGQKWYEEHPETPEPWRQSK